MLSRRNTLVTSRRLSFSAIWVGLSLAIILVDQMGYTHPVQQVTTAILGPVATAARQLGTNLSRYGDFFSDNEKLRAENAALRQQLLEAQADQGKVADLSNRVDQLEKQLKFRENPANASLNVVNADVVNRNTSLPDQSITVNKGSNDGAVRGQPVVDSSGYLVGRVARVEATQSEILLISDSSIGVNVYTQRYDANDHRVAIPPVDGTAVGQYQNGTGDVVQIERIDQNADIQANDWVFTNGKGSTYPADILVGKIDKVSAQDGQPEKSATVRPIADLDHVQQVLIITSWGS